MKATLEFSLPEERAELMSYMLGPAAHCCLSELSEWLRMTTKHSDEKDWPDAAEIRDRLLDICNENGVSVHQEY